MPICPRSRKLHRVPQGLPPLMTAGAPLTLAILFSFSLDKYYYYFIFFILVLLLLLLFCRWHTMLYRRLHIRNKCVQQVNLSLTFLDLWTSSVFIVHQVISCWRRRCRWSFARWALCHTSVRCRLHREVAHLLYVVAVIATSVRDMPLWRLLKCAITIPSTVFQLNGTVPQILWLTV